MNGRISVSCQPVFHDLCHRLVCGRSDRLVDHGSQSDNFRRYDHTDSRLFFYRVQCYGVCLFRRISFIIHRPDNNRILSLGQIQVVFVSAILFPAVIVQIFSVQIQLEILIGFQFVAVIVKHFDRNDKQCCMDRLIRNICTDHRRFLLIFLRIQNTLVVHRPGIPLGFTVRIRTVHPDIIGLGGIQCNIDISVRTCLIRHIQCSVTVRHLDLINTLISGHRGTTDPERKIRRC